MQTMADYQRTIRELDITVIQLNIMIDGRIKLVKFDNPDDGR